ncbi:MAG: hypothetical protein WC052_04630 [Patescibacteria group bacterium]|jgi:hypothetical protein
MSASTAHSTVVTLLGTYAPSPIFSATYSTHQTANLVIPSLSVEVETDTPIKGDAAIDQSEIVDNRLIRLSIRVHTGYRLGPIDTANNIEITDEVVTWLRQHINLGSGYRIFDVAGVAYNVDHMSSGTTGSEITVDIHKVEHYAQS